MIKPENFSVAETEALLNEYNKSGELYDSMVSFGLFRTVSFEELNQWRESCRDELRERGCRIFDLRAQVPNFAK